MRQAFAEADTLERFFHARGTRHARHFREAQGQFHIFHDGHARKEIEGLKDDADGLVAVPRQLEGSHAAELTSEDEDGA